MQVIEFFENLQSLPPQPDVESLRQVFKWYNDGFLDGMPYETDPLEAWRKCANPIPPAPTSKSPISLPGLRDGYKQDVDDNCAECVQV